MSDTTKTPQHGADNSIGSQQAGQQTPVRQQQGQDTPAKPQQQSGTATPGPIFKDWASI